MPQRFLRPGITTSRRFNALPLLAQSLYVRLITLVDDFGRYDADPRLLRSHAFPYGDPTGKEISLPKITDSCRELSKIGLALFYYDKEQKPVLQLLRWEERPRAHKSKYAAFENGCEQMFSDVGECSPPSSSPSSSSSPSFKRQSTNGFHKPLAPTGDFESWLGELAEGEAYKGIEVRREWAKMLEWLKTRPGLKATKRRFINWLNRIEKPVAFTERKTKPIDPAKIELPADFREWATTKYANRKDEIAGWKTWADAPDYFRTEWKRERVNPLLAKVGG